MAFQPKVSIVIPTYNRAHTVGESIASVLQQTFKQWELIVVDDGSTDATYTELREAYSDHPQVKIIRIENSGAAFARNAGVSLSTSPIITFLDSDDTVVPHWLETMLPIMNEQRADVMSCATTHYRTNGEVIVTVPQIKPGALFSYRLKMTNGGSFFLRKAIFEAVGGYDGQLRAGQHSELAIRIARYLRENNGRVAYTDEPLVNVIDRGGKSIRKNDRAVFEGMRRCVEVHRDYLRRVDTNLLHHYLSAAGARGLRVAEVSEARAYLREAITIKPLYLKGIARLVRSYLPI
ncbi:glycosyltransferase family 2 protein [Neolewinella sp.]|uniref:glycosyltransferase family 2 protein n=1 Tax=Neolewinella sp. TaxID=2993543 RepID=UPI003B51DDBA